MRTRHLAATAATLLSATFALTACGSSDYSKTNPTQIDKDARAAISKMKTAHVEATIKDDGQEISLNMDIGKEECSGTATLGTHEVEVIGVDGTFYMKADAAFWTEQAGEDAAGMVAEKWITGFPSDDFKEFCDLQELISPDDSSAKDDGAKVLGTGTVDGIAVVTLEVKSDEGPFELSVAKKAPHFIHRLVKSDGTGKMDLTDVNKAIDIKAPDGAIDINTLGQ